MKIVVIGGTGMIGRKLVCALRSLGIEASAAARSTGVDLLTAQGLADALRGADVVVDVSSSGYFDAGEMERFFERSGPRLLNAGREAGIAHHITLSVIGAGRVDGGYFRAKTIQEELVAASGLPFTIVRSTPFFEFIYKIVDAGGEGGDIRLPPVLMQPIAAHDVARALSRIALQAPANAVIEIAGPNAYRLPALAEEILTANEDGRRPITDCDAPYFGTRIGDASLTPSRNPRFASTSFEDWIRQSLVPAWAQDYRPPDNPIGSGIHYPEVSNAQ